jgi:arylsulfatase A-like enzyme
VAPNIDRIAAEGMRFTDSLLDKLDEPGLAENTIVIYSSDNGPPMNTCHTIGDTTYKVHHHRR